MRLLEKNNMIKRLISILFIPLLLVSFSGCVWLFVGAAGVVGGYAVTRDTIQGDYDAGYSDAWKSAVDVCGILGTISAKDTHKGTIESFIDKAKVKIEITQLTQEAIRVKVKARKGIFPRLGTAEKVFVKIVQKLM